VSDPTRWTTASDIRAAVQRRWDDGTVLRAFAQGEPFPRIDLPLRAPRAADLGDHFDAARAWSEQLRRGAREGRSYEILEGETGGRIAGRTRVPQRVIVAEFDQAWALLGTQTDALSYRHMVESAESVPGARDWALDHPVQTIGLGDEWQSVLAAYGWLDANRGSKLYLRQVNVPGVDTKLIERNRTVLAGMLGVPANAASFLRALGLAEKPATVRLRFDPAVFGLPQGVTEATFRVDELQAWAAAPCTALIIENEISYLSVPVPADSVVLWGKGFDVEQSASLSWLAGASVTYWGDLDTHGFAILNRVRAHLPLVRSVLMNRETLLAHRDRWGRELKPTAALLSRLTPDEASLYQDLVSDRYEHGVRLEQERLDWGWVIKRLAAADGNPETY
jgi:hypothetical protein